MDNVPINDFNLAADLSAAPGDSAYALRGGQHVVTAATYFCSRAILDIITSKVLSTGSTPPIIDHCPISATPETPKNSAGTYMAPAFAESIAVKFYEVFLYGVFFGDLMAVAVVVEGSTAWSAIKTAAASSGLRMWTATDENLHHLGMGLAEVSYGNVSGGVGIIANVEETQVLVVYGPLF